jgi:hypothetical protein
VPIRRVVLLAATAVVGCGRANTVAPTATGADPVSRTLPADQLYVLEMSGIPPEDTTVRFRTDAPRQIILRHGAPDNTVFVELSFPSGSFTTGAGDSVTVTIHPRPGVYGIDLDLSAGLGGGATIRFRYPVHFMAPRAALARYGSAVRYEAQLSVMVRLESGGYGVLRSDRPASDNLRAPLRGPGSYLVAAPR